MATCRIAISTSCCNSVLNFLSDGECADLFQLLIGQKVPRGPVSGLQWQLLRYSQQSRSYEATLEGSFFVLPKPMAESVHRPSGFRCSLFHRNVTQNSGQMQHLLPDGRLRMSFRTDHLEILSPARGADRIGAMLVGRGADVFPLWRTANGHSFLMPVRPRCLRGPWTVSFLTLACTNVYAAREITTDSFATGVYYDLSSEELRWQTFDRYDHNVALALHIRRDTQPSKNFRLIILGATVNYSDWGAFDLQVWINPKGFPFDVYGLGHRALRLAGPTTKCTEGSRTAYGMLRTAYAAQGLTLHGGVVVDLRRAAGLGDDDWWLAIYVMLSRARKLTNLILVGFTEQVEDLLRRGPPTRLIFVTEMLERRAQITSATYS